MSLPGEGGTMRIVMMVFIAFSAVCIGLTPVRAADCKGECQAVVTEVKGTCYVQQDDKGKKNRIAVGDCLLADQELQCDKFSHVKFKFCVTGGEKVVKKSYQIPKVAPLTIKDPKGAIGGRPMGGSKKQSPASARKEVEPSCQGQWLLFRP